MQCIHGFCVCKSAVIVSILQALSFHVFITGRLQRIVWNGARFFFAMGMSSMKALRTIAQRCSWSSPNHFNSGNDFSRSLSNLTESYFYRFIYSKIWRNLSADKHESFWKWSKKRYPFRLLLFVVAEMRTLHLNLDFFFFMVNKFWVRRRKDRFLLQYM